MSKEEKELILFDYPKIDEAEFIQFKKEFLYSKQRMQIARTARKFIYDLEDCIVFLKRQLDLVNKLTPKEYKSFLHDIEASRYSKDKRVKELKKENDLLIEKIAKLNLENQKLNNKIYALTN